jgi:hypothetical protein
VQTAYSPDGITDRPQVMKKTPVKNVFVPHFSDRAGGLRMSYAESVNSLWEC